MVKNKDKDQYSADSNELQTSELEPASGEQELPSTSKLAPPPQGQQAQPALAVPKVKSDVGKSYTDHPKIVYGEVADADDPDSTHKEDKEVVIKPRITATFCVGSTWHSIVKGVKVKVPVEVERILEERGYC